MKKKYKKKIIGTVTSIVILGTLVVLDKYKVIDINDYIKVEETSSKEDKNVSDKLYKVVRVVDGDTFVVDYNGTNEKVRLIGVDTPESVHPDSNKNTKEGISISNYSKDQLTDKYVELEFDVSQRDKYGRLLAYVYIDGQMYNKKLLELGYAKLATYPPNVKYVDDFTKIQKKARESKVGLWGEGGI